MVQATHTHAGPATTTRSYVEPDRAYLARLEDTIAQTVRDAVADLAPAELRWALDFTDIGTNRRLGVHGRVENAPNPSGPYDRRVWVLEIDRADRPPHFLVSHGVHPVVLGWENLGLSADWPGAMRRTLRTYGLDAQFLQGCAGDINPRIHQAATRTSKISEPR